MYFKRKQYIRILAIGGIGFMVAVLAAVMGIEKLSSFADDQYYRLTRFDLFNIVFLSDEYDLYPYIGRNNMEVLFFPVTYYFIGMAITYSNFFTKPRNYFSYAYSRVETKRKALRFMKGYGNAAGATYMIFYHMGLYYMSFSHIFQNSTSLDSLFYVYLILHGISNFLVFWGLREFTLYWFCKKNVSVAVLAGISAIIVLLLMDIGIKDFNILLFNSKFYFGESMSIAIILCFILHKICCNRKLELPY